jgi:hypothetical protein
MVVMTKKRLTELFYENATLFEFTIYLKIIFKQLHLNRSR